MATTLIVPGFGGSDEGHWQQLWLVDHSQARLVEQRNWSRPVLAEWLFALESELAKNPDALLVAHSLGAVLVANLAGRPAARHVAGALLVAPCDLDVTDRYHPGAIDFGPMPQQPLPFPATLVASRNDPYMSLERAHTLSAAWGAELTDLGASGHINIAAGFGRWPRGYELAADLGLRAESSRAAIARRLRMPVDTARTA